MPGSFDVKNDNGALGSKNIHNHRDGHEFMNEGTGMNL